MSININYLIALLLIDKVKNFRNSYTLTKVLARKFDIIEFVELMDALTKQGMIKVEVIAGIKNYEITDAGRLFINKNLETIKPIILKKYLNEKEFISSLLDE